MPEFSQETLEQAKDQAIQWLKDWDKASSENCSLSLKGLYPSVAFGLSCALAEMKGELSKREAIKLHHYVMAILMSFMMH